MTVYEGKPILNIPTGRFLKVEVRKMNTRDLILDVAFRGFLENGFEKISLNELIKRTELTKGAFYYHFKSKDKLLSDILFKNCHKY